MSKFQSIQLKLYSSFIFQYFLIMACPINNDEIAKLKMFVQVAAAQPQILNMPQLEFFKKFVEQLGGKIPEGGNFQHSRLDCKTCYQKD